MAMSVTKLKQAILALPKDDYYALLHWFVEYDNELWDRQMEEDAEAGKLEFLAKEAADAKRRGELFQLP